MELFAPRCRILHLAELCDVAVSLFLTPVQVPAKNSPALKHIICSSQFCIICKYVKSVLSLILQVFESHFTIFSQVVLKVGFLTANRCYLRSTTVQPIFLPLNCELIQFRAHEFDCKSTVWDFQRGLAKVKVCHIPHSPSMHTTSSLILGDRLVRYILPIKGQVVNLRLLSWKLNCEGECSSAKRSQRCKRPLVHYIFCLSIEGSLVKSQSMIHIRQAMID